MEIMKLLSAYKPWNPHLHVDEPRKLQQRLNSFLIDPLKGILEDLALNFIQ